jgi:hypothetical protein
MPVLAALPQEREEQPVILGGALDDVRAGLAEEGEELLVPRLHP